MADDPTKTNPAEPELEEEASPEPVAPSTPEPEQPEPELPDVEDEEPEAPEETPEEPEEKPVSRREQLRIRDVLAKIQQGNPQEEPKLPEGTLDYAEALNADPEVIKVLEADRQKTVESAYARAIAQQQSSEWRVMLNIDAPRMEQKYPVLDPNSSEFDPNYADDVNQLYLALAGFNKQSGSVANPALRYSEIVEAIMGLSDRASDIKTEKSRDNIVKQAAQTGLRPDGSSAKESRNKAPEDMSIDELRSKVEKYIPSI